MSKAKVALFRKERAEDLSRLASVLESHAICLSPYPLHQAAEQCSHPGSGGDESWEYQVVDLRLLVPAEALVDLGASEPPGLAALQISVDVDLAGQCLLKNHADPFTRLTVDMVLEGITNGSGDPCHAVWHLDRDLTGGHSPNLAHPLYHFQAGGRRLPQQRTQTIRLIMDTPRLAHPPLDAVLAVDFVLSNFFSQKWKELRQDEIWYLNALLHSQKLCWRFLANRITDPWPPRAIDSDLVAVWPQFVTEAPTI